MKRIRTNTLITILATAMLTSCRHGSPLREIKDRDLTLQAAPDDVAGDSVLAYKVRLIPDRQLLEGKTSSERTALFYRMDSCFYLAGNQGKSYAVLVQPVANGLSGSYEYLVEFGISKNDIPEKDSIALVYQDRYLNKKTYRLTVGRD